MDIIKKILKGIWTLTLMMVLFGAFAFALAHDVVMAWINF
ncbi:hypothetical protein ENTB43_314 [Enterobacter phage Entb_43]|uniref:Uncharacterized protein n=1 Tax=Cronobacter phage Pet-CM3-4 TaxID=1892569 RepID=A0A1D3RL38_9CAUD|nr:hypothetical protein KNT70_gp134 [Cronobacter phage Pet-CM3-4]UVD32671.1 hypothetical protein ENTB43_314 [Enterobacter phage Entb_43]SCN45969.1 hypothetical protein [Cronobacter phage Pet-CM3-4]